MRELLAMMRNKKFLSEWREKNPDVAKQEDEHRAALDRITALKLADFQARKADGSLDAGAIPAMPERDMSRVRPGRSVHDVMDGQSTTSPTVSAPASHGHGIDTRARAQTLNIKEEASSSPQPIPIENPPSVGWSSSAPNERTTEGSISEQNPWKTEVRDWLESNVDIPGFPLEDERVDEIAATIRTVADFDQFQKAARQQQNPRGWKVFVTIARNCQKRQEKYATASASSDRPPAEESQIEYMRRQLQIRKEIEENERHAADRRRTERSAVASVNTFGVYPIFIPCFLIN